MPDPTPSALTCKECATPLTPKKIGPPPAYCSGRCRAKASARRAKADGRAKKWAENAKIKRQAEKVIETNPCPYCGDPMTHPRRVQCGKPSCKKHFDVERATAYQRQRKEETGRWPSHEAIYERTCEGCGSTWRTRQRLAKYCSTSCANKLRSYSLSCDHCQAAFTTRSIRTRWCSTTCAAQWREAKEQERRRTAWLPALPDWPHGRAWTRIPDSHPVRQYIPRPRVFVQGNCVRCGTSFCVQATGPASYCSAKCAKADQRAKRRATQKNAYVAHVYRSRIFERDDWTCQLCHTKTDRDQVVPHPNAPVIDHIVPLAKGGTHEPANTQCAHFMCNSIKSDRHTAERFLRAL